MDAQKVFDSPIKIAHKIAWYSREVPADLTEFLVGLKKMDRSGSYRTLLRTVLGQYRTVLRSGGTAAQIPDNLGAG
jgi:hypothetical protein